jgi:REP element-mobilizing transposase RayT
LLEEGIGRGHQAHGGVRGAFLAELARVANRYRWLVLAHCLMTNHYHLVLVLPDGGLSAGMRELNGGYSRRTNVRYGRSDHLFRNRFFATKLEDDAHLLEACRYVVLNPVRAGLCRLPEEWPWSSYRLCAGIEFAPAYTATTELLRLFGPSPDEARRRYVAFVRAGATLVSDTVEEV